VYWEGKGGIPGYTPYTNLWWFLTAYTRLICYNKTAYTGIYRHLIPSIHPHLFLAIHHQLQSMPFNMPECESVLCDGDAISLQTLC